MEILLLGANGQVGWELRRSLSTIGNVIACTRSEIDLEDFTQIKNLVHTQKPDIIVNAAAYTAVDRAEEEIDKAAIINSDAVEVLANEAKKLGALLIHYSTDYVFDGKSPDSYKEDSVTNPLSVYAKTKLDGERKIISSGCRYMIFRTSWVYSIRGNNFINTMIRLAHERDELKIVSDQIASPTSADFIADVTTCCINKYNNSKSGIYNIAAKGEVSWHGFAKYIITELCKLGVDLKTKPDNVIPITTEEYPLPAERPKYSKLNTDKIESSFGVFIPDWKYHVDLILDFYKK